MTVAARPAAAWIPELDAYAEAFFESHRVPGGALVVVRDDEVLLCRGYGLRDRERGLPVTGTTRFGVASLSKSFAALTVLSLAAEGRLSLDDPATRWLPGFAYPGLDAGAVRLRHMLSHTSGVPPLRALDYAIRPSQLGDPAEAANERSYQDAPSVQDHDELLAYLRRGEGAPVAAPGRFVSYSNDVYGLIGAVVEAAAGAPFAEAARERVLAPLGMEGATFDTAEARASGELTVPYTPMPDGTVIASPRWEEAPAHLATGFMKASARDLGRSLRYLLRADDPLGLGKGALFEPHGWAEPGTAYGLGWMLGPERRGFRLVRHGGSLKGVSAHQGLVPEAGLGVAVLANLDEVPVKRLWTAAANLATGLPAGTPLFEASGGAAGPPEGAVVGRYLSGEPWGRFELRREEGALRARSGEDLAPAGRVVWLDDREFLLETEAGAWGGGRVHLDAEGEAVAVQQGMRWYVREAPRADPRRPRDAPRQT